MLTNIDNVKTVSNKTTCWIILVIVVFVFSFTVNERMFLILNVLLFHILTP